MKVYEAVASCLAAESCGPLFGLMGDGNMMLWGAIARADRIRIVSARNEAGAVAMADGYARATGNIGLATVTYGPGLTQVGTSLRVAVRNRSPLLLVVGQVAAGNRNDLYDMDQRAFAQACGARYHEVFGADNLADNVAEAFYAARRHLCPVVLGLPVDLQERSLEWDFEYIASSRHIRLRSETAGDDDVERLIEGLLAAERPVIVAGRGARASGAKEEILAVAERIGALLATTLPAKDWFAGEDYDIGICGGFASAPAEPLLREVDFVLAVGAELGYYSSAGGLGFASAGIARIDIRPAPERIGLLPGLYVCGDAKKTLAALLAKLDSRRVRKAGFRTAATRAQLQAPPHRFDKPADGLDPRLLAARLGEALPSGAVVTCGSGHFISFPAMYLALPPSADIYFSYQFGAVGQGLPLAIGVGFGTPGRPHVAIEGDGSLMMNIQELDTITRYKLPLVLIVWNDAGFGAEAHKLRARGFDARLAQWDSPDFVAIAKAFGGDGVRIRSEAEVQEALHRGLRAGGLFLIDARVSPSTMSDSYAMVHFGQENRAPLLRSPAKG